MVETKRKKRKISTLPNRIVCHTMLWKENNKSKSLYSRRTSHYATKAINIVSETCSYILCVQAWSHELPRVTTTRFKGRKSQSTAQMLSSIKLPCGRLQSTCSFQYNCLAVTVRVGRLDLAPNVLLVRNVTYIVNYWCNGLDS